MVKMKDKILSQLGSYRLDCTECDWEELKDICADVINTIPQLLINDHEWINNESPLYAISHYKDFGFSLVAAQNFVALWIETLIINLIPIEEQKFVTRRTRDRTQDFIVLFGKCKRLQTHMMELLYGSKLLEFIQYPHRVNNHDGLSDALVELTYLIDDARKEWRTKNA